MNKKLRTIMLFIFAFITILGFSDRVFAMKWDDIDDYLYWGSNRIKKSDLEQWARDSDNKKIKEVCMYYEAFEKIEDDYPHHDFDDTSFIFIYEDNTASLGYIYEGQCNVSIKAPDDNGEEDDICVDNYRDEDRSVYVRGMVNWCENKEKYGDDSGVTSTTLCEKYDASKAYADNQRCPAYMYRADNYGSKYVFLSNSTRIKESDNMEEFVDKYTTGDVDTYFNILEPVLKKDAFTTCENGEKDSDKILFKMSLKENNDHPYIILEKGDTDSFKSNENDESHTMSNLQMLSALLFTRHLEMLNKGCPATIEACSDGGGREDRGLGVIGQVNGFGLGDCPADWYDGEYIFYCKGDNCENYDYCAYASDYEEDLKNKLDEYKNTKDSVERRRILNEYNEIKNDFNSWCVSTLSHGNYYEGGCLDKCINLSNIIANLETSAGLRSPYSAKAKCNIGEQVVLMVYNVLKWAKYIAPVLVIILSILDFIKALAAQSDDEMKKAQGRFVKRLVVAALLFLIPLIINFALKTFGFYNSGCDITDLFSSSK